mgnify:CR=1 FL=1
MVFPSFATCCVLSTEHILVFILLQLTMQLPEELGIGDLMKTEKSPGCYSLCILRAGLLDTEQQFRLLEIVWI